MRAEDTNLFSRINAVSLTTQLQQVALVIPMHNGFLKTACATYICGHQLFLVINAGDCDLPLTDEGVVIWVRGDQEHFWVHRIQGIHFTLEDVNKMMNS